MPNPVFALSSAVLGGIMGGRRISAAGMGGTRGTARTFLTASG